MQDASGVQEFSYGKMGELIKNIHTFVVPGGDPYTFEMKWKYESWNRIDSIYYPLASVRTDSNRNSHSIKKKQPNSK